MSRAQSPGVNRWRDNSRGFTLVELLVALLIFVLLAVMSYGGLRTVLDAQQSFERHNDRLAELQLMFMMMGRDIEQAVDRPVRDNYGDLIPALQGGSARLEFTRAGRRNPIGLSRSQLQRVAWSVEDKELVRWSWSVLDRAQDSEAISHPMAGDVLNLEFRFLDHDGQWRGQWPVFNNTDNDKKSPALPRVVEVNVELEDWGSVTRLFRLASGRPQDKKKDD